MKMQMQIDDTSKLDFNRSVVMAVVAERLLRLTRNQIPSVSVGSVLRRLWSFIFYSIIFYLFCLRAE